MTVVSNLPPEDAEGLNKEIILKIFSSIGRCRFLEEKHFDACTAVSGSGPAFACIILEAMADGGVMMGLPRAEALELAAQSTSTLVVTSGLIHLIAAPPSITRCCSHGLTAECTPGSNQGLCH
jgi:pyrroline-5-carboxylate reductase